MLTALEDTAPCTKADSPPPRPFGATQLLNVTSPTVIGDVDVDASTPYSRYTAPPCPFVAVHDEKADRAPTAPVNVNDVANPKTVTAMQPPFVDACILLNVLVVNVNPDVVAVPPLATILIAPPEVPAYPFWNSEFDIPVVIPSNDPATKLKDPPSDEESVL